MILYLSSWEHANLLDFLSEKEESALPVKKMTGNFNLKKFVLYDMRNFSHCTELMLDRIAFSDEDNGFAETIADFLAMYSARITVICPGLDEQMPFFIKLREAGVSNIVTKRDSTEVQAEIMQSLSPEGMQQYDQPKANPATIAEQYNFTADRIRIAFIGSQSRMGTTTAAMGLAAWLGRVGAKVAYIEKNGAGIIPYLAEAYEMESDAGGYRFEKVWYGKETVDGKWHFIIEDYGACAEVIEADVIVLVCGTKPYEFPYTTSLLQRYQNIQVVILCPFVDESLHKTYKEAMETECHNVYFSEYQTESASNRQNTHIYKEIIDNYIVKCNKGGQ